MINLYRISFRWLWKNYCLLLSARSEDDAIGQFKEVARGKILNVERIERK